MTVNAGYKLKELLGRPNIAVAPGAYDCISARLIEEAGFELLYLSGAVSAASKAGLPDLGLFTMTEMIQSHYYAASAVNLPALADADSGFGNELNIIRTVKEYERAGIAAIHIEDQAFPKRCGHLSNKVVIPVDEFMSKIRAAIDARESDDFLIFARTDARLPEGVDNAIERARKYIDAGADGLFFEAPQTYNEIERVAKEFAGKTYLLSNMVTGGKTPPVNKEELEQMGYDIVIHPSICVFAIMQSVRNALHYLKENGTEEGLFDKLSPYELFKLVGIEDWLDKERKYGK